MSKSDPRIGDVKKKELLLLQAGLALGLYGSLGKHGWILRQLSKEWEKINRQALNRAIKSLYASRLVEERHYKDGTTTLVLSENGKRRSLRFDIEKMEIKRPTSWDGRWRIVMFDIPEKLKQLRDTLRLHFQDIGMIELQKSVFVHPYPCGHEIEFILELYDARKYVRLIVAETIDNQLHLKKKFKLI